MDDTTPDRRALRQRFRETAVPAGVYAISNRTSGRVLLGASLNVEAALRRHRFELGLRGHRCRALQADWLALGADAFVFEVLATVKERDDPSFDRQAELDDLLALWDEELAGNTTVRYTIG